MIVFFYFLDSSGVGKMEEETEIKRTQQQQQM
jgi:hypothetical protein